MRGHFIRIARWSAFGLLCVALGSSWPLFSARFRPALPLYQSRILPDLDDTPSGYGFSATGVAIDEAGAWAGIGYTEPSPMAGVARMSPDFDRIERTVTLLSLGLDPASVQGVATDGVRVWFIAKGKTHGRLVELDKAGRLSRTMAFGHGRPNGLAYDAHRNALVVLFDDKRVEWRDLATWKGTGLRGEVRGVMPDHLLIDGDRLLVTSGRNGKDGNLAIYSLPDMAQREVYRLSGADAIEGLALQGDKLIVMNDAGTHHGLPDVNRVLEYRLPR